MGAGGHADQTSSAKSRLVFVDAVICRCAATFLGANLGAVSSHWTSRINEIMQRQATIPHLVFAASMAFVAGVFLGSDNSNTFVSDMILTPLKPAQHPD